MELPKVCIAQVEGGDLWGAVRLHQPVMVVELEPVQLRDDLMNCRPWVWPPDILAGLTEDDADSMLADLWIMFEGRGAIQFEGVEEMHVELGRELPRFLVLDNDVEDFTGVLDTETGLLWSADKNLLFLTLVKGWRMHPGMMEVLDMRACQHSVLAFWRKHGVAAGWFDEDEDRRGWAG